MVWGSFSQGNHNLCDTLFSQRPDGNKDKIKYRDTPKDKCKYKDTPKEYIVSLLAQGSSRSVPNLVKEEMPSRNRLNFWFRCRKSAEIPYLRAK